MNLPLDILLLDVLGIAWRSLTWGCHHSGLSSADDVLIVQDGRQRKSVSCVDVVGEVIRHEDLLVLIVPQIFKVGCKPDNVFPLWSKFSFAIHHLDSEPCCCQSTTMPNSRMRGRSMRIGALPPMM